MADQEVGKELVLTPPEPQQLAERSKPTLVQVGNRLTSSDGRFHTSLCADYLMEQSRKSWVTVATLAKIFGGSPTIEVKRRVRKNMFSVFMALLGRGEFLVYETISNGRINAVKLLDVKSEHERQAALPQLERMKQRHQLSTAKYERALQVLELQERVSDIAS